MLHVKGRRGVRGGFIGREELPAPTQAGGGQCVANASPITCIHCTWYMHVNGSQIALW